MSLIRKHRAVLQAWACLALVTYATPAALNSGPAFFTLDLKTACILRDIFKSFFCYTYLAVSF